MEKTIKKETVLENTNIKVAEVSKKDWRTPQVRARNIRTHC